MQHFSYLAEIFVVGGIASALIIAIDQRTCRQSMKVMNSVWILTGLWASVVGLWGYFTFGRPRRCDLEEQAGGRKERSKGGKPGTDTARMDMRGTASAAETERMADMDMADQRARTKTDSPGTDMPAGTETTARMAGMGHMADMDMAGQRARTKADSPGMDMPAGTKSAARMAGMPGMDRSGNGRMAETGMQAGTKSAAGMESMAGMDMSVEGSMAGMRMPERPKWESVVLSTLHCGAGCTLADLVGEWFMYFVPIAVGGSLLAGTWVVDYILALVFGIGFQYAAIRGMERTLPRSKALRRAAKADVLSLTAWQAGMYGWMAIVIFVLSEGAPPPRTSFLFWFMMQIAMACGFLVALPVNMLLIKAGVKKGM